MHKGGVINLVTLCVFNVKNQFKCRVPLAAFHVKLENHKFLLRLFKPVLKMLFTLNKIYDIIFLNIKILDLIY